MAVPLNSPMNSPTNSPMPPAAPAVDPLANLRDIHLPANIDAWPPAFGWWLLGAMTIIATGLLIYSVWRYWRSRRYRREAMLELRALYSLYQREQDPQDYLRTYTELLKRVALTHYPRDQVAALTGEAWVNFLDSTAQSHEFSLGAGQVLIQGQYQNQTEVDVEALQRLGSHWIKRHRALPAGVTP